MVCNGERGKLYRKKKVKAKGCQSQQRREGSTDVMRIIFRAVQIIFPRSRDTIYSKELLCTARR